MNLRTNVLHRILFFSLLSVTALNPAFARQQDPTICAGQSFPDFCQMRIDVPAVNQGAAIWGDFDRDGDFDMVVAGNQGAVSEPDAVTKFFRNTGDIAYFDPPPDETGALPPGAVLVYEISQTELIASVELTRPEQLWQSTTTFADIDNDNDLDLLTAGMDPDGAPQTYIYENTNDPIRQFSLRLRLPGLSASAAAFADYDNDGDQDFILTGLDASGQHRTILYQNQWRQQSAFSFLEQPTNLTGLAFGTADWGDYDADGDMDLLLAGLAQGQRNQVKVYRNDGGALIDANTTLNQLLFASAAFGDYDADGDLDIVVNGGKLSPFVVEGTGALFRNDNNSFTDTGVTFDGGYQGRARWGDYDGDGRLDLLVSGGTRVGATPTARAYRNLGSDLFTLAHDFGGGLLGEMTWADYDNDGDLDMLLAGLQRTASPIIQGYRNELPRFNSRPGAPTNLQATVDGSTVTFSWQAATDLQTPAPGLSYNVRVGTIPGGNDIMSPLADLANGYRYLSARGNVDHNLSWQVQGLAAGTYYWSVQAIDPTFQGSVFAQEGFFTISN